MKWILTPRQLAEAIGVSESSVKRWVDDGHIEATRTRGGHRRISLQEATRYIRETGSAVVRPELLGLHELDAPGSVAGDDDGEALFEYLRVGAEAEARGLVLSRFLEGRSAAQLIDGPVAYAMEKLGELWIASPSGIFWEHRATQITIQAVGRVRMLMAPDAQGGVAIGGAPTGDRYILPSLAAATVLEGVGVRATNLGPETPIRTLALGVDEVGARLAWVSVSVAVDVDDLRRELQALAASLGRRGGLLVVGGAQVGKLGLARSESLYVGRSMGELEALVEGMKLAPRSAGAPA